MNAAAKKSRKGSLVFHALSAAASDTTTEPMNRDRPSE